MQYISDDLLMEFFRMDDKLNADRTAIRQKRLRRFVAAACLVLLATIAGMSCYIRLRNSYLEKQTTHAELELDAVPILVNDVKYQMYGDSPYAKSKIMAEEYLTKWCLDHQVRLGILRPSLLAGKNAPGNLGAMVKGIKKGYYMNIAGGKVVKSILMTEDIARLVPLLEEKGGVYNVCDTRQPSFGEISMSVAKQLGKGKPLDIPYWLAWCLAKVGDLLGDKAPINSYKLEKMTKSLTFSNEKAKYELGWEPLDVLENFKV